MKEPASPFPYQRQSFPDRAESLFPLPNYGTKPAKQSTDAANYSAERVNSGTERFQDFPDARNYGTERASYGTEAEKYGTE